ncbi:MAG TPA: DUF433 domain-containing protein [Capsulimonadaceae bacterium]|jgi:uncharacterized protein (DUF433 family)
MIPKQLAGVLTSSQDTLSGVIRFDGTRVPVQALLDTLYSGKSVDDFLAGFPNVTRQQAEAVIRWEQELSRDYLGLEAAA